MKKFHKIINDPVYGFITIDDELIHQIIQHPFYQRLRRIHQMALAHLVYPGAVHSRLHHSLGAYHLMTLTLQELINKGVDISSEEQQAAKIAILLHDIGHGPFSHALEHSIAGKLHHEELSLMMMRILNNHFKGQLQLALDIFTNQHPKKFLHQLISGQLDVDRMDYLTRDCFFTGVNEGLIGYDRIIKMLTVHNGELMVEEKGIYSIEKFLIARRLMYWQVYFHKTVVSAEQMLQRIIKRAKETIAPCAEPLHSFINSTSENISIQQFCQIDDFDVLMAIKTWCNHQDKVLSFLCNAIIDRQLLKVKFFTEPITEELIKEKREEASSSYGLKEDELNWLVFIGEASSRTYDFESDPIKILYKDGTIRDIATVDNALINQNLNGLVKKYYICYPK